MKKLISGYWHWKKRKENCQQSLEAEVGSTGYYNSFICSIFRHLVTRSFIRVQWGEFRVHIDLQGPKWYRPLSEGKVGWNFMSLRRRKSHLNDHLDFSNVLHKNQALIIEWFDACSNNFSSFVDCRVKANRIKTNLSWLNALRLRAKNLKIHCTHARTNRDIVRSPENHMHYRRPNFSCVAAVNLIFKPITHFSL